MKLLAAVHATPPLLSRGWGLDRLYDGRPIQKFWVRDTQGMGWEGIGGWWEHLIPGIPEWQIVRTTDPKHKTNQCWIQFVNLSYTSMHIISVGNIWIFQRVCIQTHQFLFAFKEKARLLKVTYRSWFDYTMLLNRYISDHFNRCLGTILHVGLGSSRCLAHTLNVWRDRELYRCVDDFSDLSDLWIVPPWNANLVVEYISEKGS